jgi:hypothetical protein
MPTFRAFSASNRRRIAAEEHTNNVVARAMGNGQGRSRPGEAGPGGTRAQRAALTGPIRGGAIMEMGPPKAGPGSAVAFLSTRGRHLVETPATPSTMSGVTGVQEYVVSSSGQMSLPAAARHRWKLDGGGPVDVIDLGFAVLTLPSGQGRRLLSDLLSRDEHAQFVKSLADDPELATT